MFDKLIDVLLSFLHLFRFWTIVSEYERAIVLRLGKFHRRLEPGWHPLIPFNIEHVLSDNVVPATKVLPPQSLTTKDNKSIVISAIVIWRIVDIKKLLLEVEGGEAVVLDIVAGEICRAVAARPWESVQSPRFVRDVSQRVTELAEPYGISIDKFQLRDIIICPSFRLFRDNEIILLKEGEK